MSSRLWYSKPAPDRGMTEHEKWRRDPDWESWSLPLGCGYFGVCVFGKTDNERLQITENSLANPYRPGLNNFAEMRMITGHREADCTHYTRDLDLDEATAHVRYEYKGVEYRREYLTSYPDRVMAVLLTASEPGSISFCLNGEIPYCRPFGEEEHIGKRGEVKTEAGDLVLPGEMEYYGILFEGRFTVKINGGEMKPGASCLNVTGADSALILGTVGTNYQMKESVFLEPDRTKKLEDFPHPHEQVAACLKHAAAKEWDELKRRHVEDYKKYYSRVRLNLGAGAGDLLPTDERLIRYQDGCSDPGLEALYFQYGRYLLISSSRKGALPANLQGVWNQYERSPWSAGYWHNINVQMNYWPAFTTNLAELFESYADYHQTFRKLAQRKADDYVTSIRKRYPQEPYAEEPGEAGKNGWAIGTGAWPYTIEGPKPGGHSGPGTGGLTAKLFWDYYEFTKDQEVLEHVVYPVLEGMSCFLSKTVVKEGDEYLAYPSASPEQCIDGIYPNYYETKGCMFDQQMIYECYRDTKKAAELLGRDSSILHVIEEQIDHLTPVLIGRSGQIKEYREEAYYGEIGEYKHRHLSQLIGLMPGQSIHKDRAEWLKAAKYTLAERGDESTGWAMAHRLCAWARIGDGVHAHTILKNLLRKGTTYNLWDIHPPFQIDGNFGGTAGIAEMLLQSHGGFIEPLPAIPEEWKSGSFKGLVARGNFVVDAIWKDGRIVELSMVSRVGGVCELRYPGIGCFEQYHADIVGNTGEIQRDNDRIRWETTAGDMIRLYAIRTESEERRKR